MANDNSGALFKNEKKREGKSDPDYQGSITIAGVEYWLTAWINEAKNTGQKYMALKAKPKEAKPEATQADADRAWAEAEKKLKPATQPQDQAAAPLDDEIPF